MVYSTIELKTVKKWYNRVINEIPECFIIYTCRRNGFIQSGLYTSLHARLVYSGENSLSNLFQEFLM